MWSFVHRKSLSRITSVISITCPVWSGKLNTNPCQRSTTWNSWLLSTAFSHSVGFCPDETLAHLGWSRLGESSWSSPTSERSSHLWTSRMRQTYAPACDLQRTRGQPLRHHSTEYLWNLSGKGRNQNAHASVLESETSDGLEWTRSILLRFIGGQSIAANSDLHR